MNMVIACDFCGCYMGITPYDNQSGVSFLYRYKSYNGYNIPDQEHHLFPGKSAITGSSLPGTSPVTGANQLKHGTTLSQGVPAQKDYEIYSTMELRAKYFIQHRTELNVILPYISNSSRTSNDVHRASSVGDITLLASYRILERTLTERFQNRLVLGGGVKLPTGNFNIREEDGERLDCMLQPGTGTADYLAYVNYIFSYRKVGLNFNSSYKINGENRFKERIGGSSTSYLNLFAKLRSDKKLKLFPSLQAYYEYSSGLFIDKRYQNGTAMNVAMAGIGLDIFYKNLSLNGSFQLPFYEETMPSNLSSAGKFMIGITYSFNQKSYLLGSKKQLN
jgi:hypothetical protein